MGRVKKIHISPRVLMLMQQELNRKKLELQYSLRIQIILKSNQGLGNKEIASFLGCNVKTVSYWRSRWDFTPDVSNDFEQGKDGKGASDKTLMSRVLSILSDKFRSGHGPTLSEPDLFRPRALACGPPED